MSKLSKQKIVLVEDDVYIARAYKEGLGRAGYDTVVIHDGADAVPRASSRALWTCWR